MERLWRFAFKRVQFFAGDPYNYVSRQNCDKGTLNGTSCIILFRQNVHTANSKLGFMKILEDGAFINRFSLIARRVDPLLKFPRQIAECCI